MKKFTTLAILLLASAASADYSVPADSSSPGYDEYDSSLSSSEDGYDSALSSNEHVPDLLDFEEYKPRPEDPKDPDDKPKLEEFQSTELLQVERGRNNNRNNPFLVLDSCLDICRRGRFSNNRAQRRCENNCRSDFDHNVQQCVSRCDNPRFNPNLSNQQRRNCQRDCRRRPNNGNSRIPSDRCVGNVHPQVRRNGQRFRFNLAGSNQQCVDRHHELYQWGQFNHVHSFEDCANVCVNHVPSNLAFNNSFRGIEYLCETSQCRCLYDRGFLNRSIRRLPGRFNRANTRERGVGSIQRNRGRFNRNYFCGTLA